MFYKIDISFGAFFLIMLVLGIFRFIILHKKYGKNMSYFIFSLLAFFLALPFALYGLYEAYKLYKNINVNLYVVLLITAALGNIFFSLILVKFKRQ